MGLANRGDLGNAGCPSHSLLTPLFCRMPADEDRETSTEYLRHSLSAVDHSHREDLPCRLPGREASRGLNVAALWEEPGSVWGEGYRGTDSPEPLPRSFPSQLLCELGGVGVLPVLCPQMGGCAGINDSLLAVRHSGPLQGLCLSGDLQRVRELPF